MRNVIQEFNLPLVRLGVQYLSDKQDRVILVELDEFDKRVIRHQIIGNFFRGGFLCGGGGRGGGHRVMGFGGCLVATSAATAAKRKGGGIEPRQPQAEAT